MKFSLIVPTYRRATALNRLLESIKKQTIKPFEIIIIDASEDDLTKDIVQREGWELSINYQKVAFDNKGLVPQRNYGIKLISDKSEIVAFLDDDLIVEPDYFEKILETYEKHPDAIGVGGIDLKENGYFKKPDGAHYDKFNYYEFDGWIMKEPLRYRVRKLFGLMSDLQPGLIPEYSHGRSTLPPTGKIYKVEHLMGCMASFKKELFDKIRFSPFFKGYGLYEDFDFSVRALNYGKLYIDTGAIVWHYHEPSGRPNLYKYGKMVVRNGWYVWRIRFPNPSLKSRYKWHATTLLLAFIRLMNVITGPERKNAMLDFTGRIVAWVGVLINPPRRTD